MIVRIFPIVVIVVIVTASYNGQPPDNATKFCQKLRDPALPADAFAGVEYSVFGCGNRDWSATYQAIPTLIDAELEKHGGKRIYKRGEGDARGDFDRDYRAWYGELFPSLATALDLPTATAEPRTAGPRISVSFVNCTFEGSGLRTKTVSTPINMPSDHAVTS